MGKRPRTAVCVTEPAAGETGRSNATGHTCDSRHGVRADSDRNTHLPNAAASTPSPDQSQASSPAWWVARVAQ